jgi:hypothetical protein
MLFLVHCINTVGEKHCHGDTETESQNYFCMPYNSSYKIANFFVYIFPKKQMPPKEKRRKYCQDDVIAAVGEIKNGATYRVTSEKYGIPVMTLSDKVKGKAPLVRAQPGPSSHLSEDQEHRLVKWLLHMAKIGYGVMRKDIPGVVKRVLDEAVTNGYIIPEGKTFVDNKPSVCWVYGFLRRHPRISPRTPENLGFQRAYITERGIRDWFERLDIFLREEHDLDANIFLSELNADRIFNLDESGFPLQGTNGKLKIITDKGARNVYKLAPDTKEQITVLACSAADGSYSKPLVIFPGLRTPKYNFHGVRAEDYDVGFTPNG